MGKIKPTTQMLEFRKKQAKQQLDYNQKMNDYNQKANIKLAAVKRRLDKLSKDRDLAAEAAIGYGLAIKAIEDNIRKIESEIDDVKQEVDQNRPPFKYYTDEFKAEFGVSDSEVEWSEAQV